MCLFFRVASTSRLLMSPVRIEVSPDNQFLRGQLENLGYVPA
jgi:hypothetical protein